jgi:hypothetical protein
MEPEYQDIELKCICGKDFIWELGEQKFMHQLLDAGKIPSVQTPKRCPECRAKKKAEREAKNNDY